MPLQPKCQLYPGLHQKMHGQQVEGGDPAPLLCTGETSPGVLHPDEEFSVQKRHGESLQEEMASRSGRVDLDTRKKSFTVRMVRH